MAGIILPSPEEREVDQQLKPLYEIWKVEKEATEEQWRPQNIKFDHDPEWRNRFWSLTYAASRRSWFWNAVGALFFASSISWFSFKLLISLGRL